VNAATEVLDPQGYSLPHLRSSLSSHLFKYIVSEYLLSFLISFLFFFGIFLVNQLIVIARDVLSKQVEISKALLLLFYSTPAVIALAFPFGSLVGALLTVGRFGADNEILAMQSLGYGLRMIFLPIFCVSLALTGFSFTINNIFLPLGTIQYRGLLEKLLYSNTELVLQPYGVTSLDNTNTTIVTDSVASGNIGAILLFDSSEEGRDRILAAKYGKLDKSAEDAGLLKLDLNAVSIVKQGTVQTDIDVSTADNMTYAIKLKDLSRNIKNVLPSEMSFVDIYKNIEVKEQEVTRRLDDLQQKLNLEKLLFMQDYQNSPVNNQLALRLQNVDSMQKTNFKDRDLQLHWVEYWKKLSIPSACTTLVLLGIPLGLFAKKSAKGLGIGLGLVVAAFFWGGLLLGQFAALDNVDSSAFIYMWAPNFLFTIVGLLSFIPLVRR